MRKKKQRRQTNIDLNRDIEFAKQQVNTAKSALNNPDIDPKLRARIVTAQRYWQNKIDELQNQ